MLLDFFMNSITLKLKDMARELRIVELIYPNGNKAYQIQKKHWLVKNKWISVDDGCAPYSTDTSTYLTLEEAKKHLCYFDGTKTKTTNIYNL